MRERYGREGETRTFACIFATLLLSPKICLSNSKHSPGGQEGKSYVEVYHSMEYLCDIGLAFSDMSSTNSGIRGEALYLAIIWASFVPSYQSTQRTAKP